MSNFFTSKIDKIFAILWLIYYNPIVLKLKYKNIKI